MVGDPHWRVYRGIDLAKYVLTIGLPISLIESLECHPLVEPTSSRIEPTATPQTPVGPPLTSLSPTRAALPSSSQDCHDHVEMEDR